MNRRQNCKILLMIACMWCLLLTSIYELHAQSPRDSIQHVNVHWWLNFGVGIASRGIGGNISGNVQYSQYLATVGFYGVGEIFLGDSYEAYGILFGLQGKPSTIRKPPTIHYSIAAGIASVKRRYSSLFGTIREYPAAIGFPLEIQFFALPSKFFGIGSCAFFIFSTYTPLVGVTISIQFGSLR